MDAASWAFGPGKEEQAREAFLAVLRLAVGDAESARAEAREFGSLDKWRERLQLRISAAAGGTSLIPYLHGGGIALEIPYLLRLMARGAIGTGELLNAKIEPEEDLLAIFALWSGAINKAAVIGAVGGVVVINGIAYPQFGAKVLALAFNLGFKSAAARAGLEGAVGAAAGIALSFVLQPVFGHVAAAISAKISSKIGAKLLAGMVPFIGACVGIGISYYVLTELLNAARTYYQLKASDAMAS